MDLKGCWTTKQETDTHVFDQSLCDAIITICNNQNIKTVADIGCGDGSYTKHFIYNSIVCDGFDGSPLTTELTWGLCYIKDFSEPQNIGKYGLVLSLEVGEHIPAEYEQIFFDNLVNASIGLIILSWAVEGQGGDGHINCRDNDYIIQQMKDRGYDFDKDTTEYLKDKATVPWFKNTVLVFER
jgi:hypothetical protein